MNISEIKKLDIPPSPGSYRFLNKKGDIIYIGKAADLRSRVFSYWRRSANHSPAKKKMMKEIKAVEWTETETEIEAMLLEANLIKKYQPYYNILLRDDKRFAYIKVSTADEIPGVFISRKIDKAGKYFGPFTSTRAMRETLKALRRIWPYCTERRLRKKPCFYYQINRCCGVCGGKVNLADYREKIIKPIVLFLSGKKGRVIKDMEKNIRQLRKEGQSNEAARQEYYLLNMKKVLAHARILSVAEKYEADVFELAKELNLSRVPQRIEGYDISNIFGREAVGSMVVFNGGEPNKNEYRKFKIRLTKSQANDVLMLKEVLERRFKHSLTGDNGSKKERWPMPDLLIVDGGKGQLNAAGTVLRKLGLDIPLIAISKGEGLRSAQAPDKIFFPGESNPLELPLASPALHIIKRVRDEAHRFAISYHRQLRGKKFLDK